MAVLGGTSGLTATINEMVRVDAGDGFEAVFAASDVCQGLYLADRETCVSEARYLVDGVALLLTAELAQYGDDLVAEMRDEGGNIGMFIVETSRDGDTAHFLALEEICIALNGGDREAWARCFDDGGIKIQAKSILAKALDVAFGRASALVAAQPLEMAA